MTKEIKVEIWNVEDLKPYDKNAKKHSKDQVRKLARSIKEHGWTQPIVIDGTHDRGVIVVGHGRRLAAIELGLKKISVQVLYNYTQAEIDAIRLADNRLASTDYDTEMLQEELARLAGEGVDLEGFGFDAAELDFMAADLGDLSDDAFVESVTEAVEAQTEENKEKIAATDASNAPVTDALGFKRVTIEQSRKIRGMMATIEEKTKLKGADAFIAYLGKSLGVA
jgi:hypothetical protein